MVVIAWQARAANDLDMHWKYGRRILQPKQGEMAGGLAELRGCHAGADFGAQFVDQPEALVRLDVPERPAVAGAGALRHRADAMNRSDLVTEHDGADGPHQSSVALLRVHQLCARQDHAALD